MTIYEQIKDALKNKINELVSPQEVKKTLQENTELIWDSIILSDYCYNRYNRGFLLISTSLIL